MISPSQLDQVRDSIVEVIGSRIDLTQRGRKWMGRCPFHSPDRTPSFEINEAKKAWFCNVCNLGGDTFTFVQKFHDTNFAGACELLGIAKESDPNKKHLYREGMKKIRWAEEAQIGTIRERYESLAAVSRQMNLLMNQQEKEGKLSEEDRRFYDSYFDREFKLLNRLEEMLREFFQDKRKELRVAL